MKENLIKLYFYITSGQTVVDQFRYLIMGIFTLYIMLKLTNYGYLIVMFVLSAPILFLLGYINIHYISKVKERLSIQHGTHYGLKQFELIEKQTTLLQDISDTIHLTTNNKKVN